MYSVILMMALSNGAGAPTYDAAFDGPVTHSTGHYAYRGGRGGCCGCHQGGRHHHNGCCGCYSYCGCYCYNYSYCGCYGYQGGGAPGQPGPQPATGGKQKAVAETEKTQVTQATMAPATIVVTLPEDAVLKIDDRATASTSQTRQFVTPEMSSAGEYHYTLTAEIIRDGERLTSSKQIAVSGGKETRVSIEFPIAAVAQR